MHRCNPVALRNDLHFFLEFPADEGVPVEGSGFPGFTLTHNAHTAEEVDRLLKEVAASGGSIVNRPARGPEPILGALRRSGWLLVGRGLGPHFPHV